MLDKTIKNGVAHIAHRVIPLTCFALASMAHAQTASCGLTEMHDGATPIYPPIARAAQVEGTVVLLATFDISGKVISAEPISGAPMLRGTAQAYVSTWKANAYTGARQCRVAVTFRLIGNIAGCGSKEDVLTPSFTPFERTDLQHVIVTSKRACYNT